jgi:hypothetical protein
MVQINLGGLVGPWSRWKSLLARGFIFVVELDEKISPRIPYESMRIDAEHFW